MSEMSLGNLWVRASCDSALSLRERKILERVVITGALRRVSLDVAEVIESFPILVNNALRRAGVVLDLDGFATPIDLLDPILFVVSHSGMPKMSEQWERFIELSLSIDLIPKRGNHGDHSSRGAMKFAPRARTAARG